MLEAAWGVYAGVYAGEEVLAGEVVLCLWRKRL
jgi:hypothetical protein